MEKNTLTIRAATPADAAALLEIYAPYVEKTAISFEYAVPTVEEFRGRIAGTLEKYPYLVAEADGAPVGYAYAGAFKSRQAYDHAAETTVYVRQGLRRGGIGRQLYGALERVCRAQHILNLNACIGYPVREDPHLTRDSAHFHKAMGWRTVAHFHKCGCKFGTWYDMIWMEKWIGRHTAPTPVRPFSSLTEGELAGLGILSKRS